MKEKRAREETELMMWHRKWTHKSVKALQDCRAKKISVHKNGMITDMWFFSLDKNNAVMQHLKLLRERDDDCTLCTYYTATKLINEQMDMKYWFEWNYVRKPWSDMKDVKSAQLTRNTVSVSPISVDYAYYMHMRTFHYKLSPNS